MTLIYVLQYMKALRDPDGGPITPYQAKKLSGKLFYDPNSHFDSSDDEPGAQITTYSSHMYYYIYGAELAPVSTPTVVMVLRQNR